MSTEQLVVELQAKVTEAQKDLEGVQESLKDLGDESTKADSKVGDLAKGVKSAAGFVAGFTKAALAAGAALTTYITLNAKAVQETSNLAFTAKTSTENFKALSFAFSQVGVDAQGVANAMNDVSERIGEFSAAQSGPFQDFVDVMRLSEDSALEFAQSLQRESPEDAIRLMVEAMEEANVEGAQVSFVLKSMSNDLEFANRLFKNNGEELDRLKDRYSEMHKALGLTNEQAKDLKDSAENFDLMTKSLKQGSALISSELAPTFTKFFSWVAENVPIATNAVVDFINSWRDPDAINNVNSLRRLMAENNEEIERMIELQSKETDQDFAASRRKLIVDLMQQNEEYQKQIDILEETKAKVQELAELEDLPSGKGVIPTILYGSKDDDDEEESAADQFEEEMQRVHDSTSVFVDNLLNEFRKMDDEEAESNRIKNKAKEDADKHYFTAAKNIGNLLFEDNKEIQAGLIIADTARNVVTSVANNGGIPFGIPAGLAAASMGALQLANVLGARKGGGSINSSTPALPANPGTVTTATAEPQQNVFITGLNPDQLFSGAQVLELLNNEILNGGRVVGVSN